MAVKLIPCGRNREDGSKCDSLDNLCETCRSMNLHFANLRFFFESLEAIMEAFFEMNAVVFADDLEELRVERKAKQKVHTEN